MEILKINRILVVLSILCACVGCQESNDSTQSTETSISPNANEVVENGENHGNAGDTSMPNTMALAAGAASKSTYSGNIDGRIEAKMELFQANDILRGTITYKKSGKPILVLGKVLEDGSLFLHEFLPDGRITGTISGKYGTNGFSGDWYGNEKELDIQMTLVSESTLEEWPFNRKGSVAGEYAFTYPDQEKGDPGPMGTMKVKQDGSSVTFSIDCVNGPPAFHIASVENTTATLQGDLLDVDLEDLDCKFIIQFFEGFAVVRMHDGPQDCGFGMGAGIEGEYVKVK